jgi:hypothetical protein
MKRYAEARINEEWYSTVQISPDGSELVYVKHISAQEMGGEPEMSEEIDAVLWKIVQGADLGQFTPLDVDISFVSGRQLTIKLLDPKPHTTMLKKADSANLSSDSNYQKRDLARITIELKNVEIVISHDMRLKEKFDLNNPTAFIKASEALENMFNQILESKAEEASTLVSVLPPRMFRANKEPAGKKKLAGMMAVASEDDGVDGRG